MDSYLPSFQRLGISPQVDTVFVLEQYYPFLLLKYHDVIAKAMKSEINEVSDSTDVVCEEDCEVRLLETVSDHDPPACMDGFTGYEKFSLFDFPQSGENIKKWLIEYNLNAAGLLIGHHLIMEIITQSKKSMCQSFILYIEKNKVMSIRVDIRNPHRVTEEFGFNDSGHLMFTKGCIKSLWYGEDFIARDELILHPKKKTRGSTTTVATVPLSVPNTSSKRARQEGAEEMEETESEESNVQHTCKGTLTLDTEYKTHCLWLRMRKTLCQLSDKAFEDNPREYIEMLPQEEGGVLSDMWVPLDQGVRDTGNWDKTYNIWQILKHTQPDAAFHEFFTTLSEKDIEQSIMNVNSLSNETLEIGVLPPFGHSSFGSTTKWTTESKLYKSWLRWFMTAVTGCVYSPKTILVREDETDTPLTRKQVDAKVVTMRNTSRNNEDAEFTEETLTYQIEHTTPQAWTKLTRILYEFRHVTSDPTLLLIVDTTMQSNQSRQMKPLRFSDSAPDFTYKAWTHPNAVEEMVACVARMIIHATMTYPLVTRKIGNGFNPLPLDTSNLGIPEYAAQIKTIVKYALKTPARWEVRIALQCYARFACVNPLVVSRKTRELFSNPNNYFYKLLQVRWGGTSILAKHLIESLLSVTNVESLQAS
jgi:hypothetical protein